MNLIMFYAFMQVLNNIRNHSTKNEYFPMHIIFTTIYVLQKQKLNPRNCSEQEIDMGNFVQATECDMNMHVKIKCMNMHGFLYIISSSFSFLEFYIIQ
jgi:hypothetical protein